MAHVEKTIVSTTENILPYLYRIQAKIGAILKDVDINKILGGVKGTDVEQGLEIIDRILELFFSKKPKETLEIIGLCCFVEPEKLSEYNSMELLSYVPKILTDPNVRRFFSSLLQILKKKSHG